MDNIYVRFGGQLFRETVGIRMGTNCAPLLADVFLYSYENEFLHKLIKEGKRKLVGKFNLSYSYIDDLISFNNKRFKKFISDIYPRELTISETTEFTPGASYLNLLFIRGKSDNITTKLYDKRDNRSMMLTVSKPIFHMISICVILILKVAHNGSACF